MKVDVAQVLQLYDVEDLVRMVAAQGILVGKRKADLVRALAANIGRADLVRRSLLGLGKAQQSALDRLVLRGGEVSTAAFERELVRLGLVEAPKDVERSYSSSNAGPSGFAKSIASLGALGLVLSDQPGVSMIRLESPGKRLFIPDGVLKHLPPVRPVVIDPPPTQVLDGVYAQPSAFQRDLFLYWRFVRRNEVTLTSRETLPKRMLTKVTECLAERESLANISGEQELGRTFFLRLMMQEAQLLSESSNGTLSASHEALSFFSLPSSSRTQRCYQTWLRALRWNELRRLADVEIDFGNSAARSGAPTRVLEARKFVTSQLANLPVGRWIPLAYLFEQAAIADYEFLLRRLESSAYGQRYANAYERYGNELGLGFVGLKDDERGWQLVEGGFITAVLSEPLHWLGLVALGRTKRRADSFLITELGGAILRGKLPPEPPAPERTVVVQPNFQVFAFEPVGEDVLAALDSFADLVRADKAVEFRLTRESVYRAQQEGINAPQIVSVLEEMSARELPQNVRRTLEEWDSHHERIVVRRNVKVLHAASAELLDRLFSSEEVGPLLERRVAPGAAILSAQTDDRRLKRILLDKGYLPAFEGTATNPGKAVVTVEPDGGVCFRQRLPSVHLWKQLWPITEELNGAMWITAGSVRRAVDWGGSAEEIIGRLAEVHRGPLPATLVDQIKVWANHWGDVALHSVTLLRVKDAEALAELMRDESVGALLRPFTPEGALALVSQADAARLREVLTAKGIPLVEQPIVSSRR